MARQRAAEARRQFVQALGHFDSDLRAFRRFDELSQRVDETEAEADAQSELCGAEIEDARLDAEIEAGLQALKRHGCRRGRSSWDKYGRITMTFATTVVFYLTFGTGVAVAVYLRDLGRTPSQRFFRVVVATFFWPLYLPLLLEHAPDTAAEEDRKSAAADPSDSLAHAIGQVESELDAALGRLDGWAEEVLVDERQRLDELRMAWRSQAARVRELDRFLAQPDAIAVEAFGGPLNGQWASSSERRNKSERGRLENIRRLHELRRRMFDDLLATLAWVRELVTMIHLAKFSGAPASRAEELVSQIAASVEGLREVSIWCEMSPQTGDTSDEMDDAPQRSGCQGTSSRGLVTPACDGSGGAAGGSEMGRIVERSAPTSVLSVAPETA